MPTIKKPGGGDRSRRSETEKAEARLRSRMVLLALAAVLAFLFDSFALMTRAQDQSPTFLGQFGDWDSFQTPDGDCYARTIYERGLAGVGRLDGDWLVTFNSNIEETDPMEKVEFNVEFTPSGEKFRMETYGGMMVGGDTANIIRLMLENEAVRLRHDEYPRDIEIRLDRTGRIFEWIFGEQHDFSNAFAACEPYWGN